KLRRLSRAVLERVLVEREDFGLASLVLDSFVETLTGFLAGEAAFDHPLDEIRQDEHRLGVRIVETLLQVLDDVRQDVHAREIERAERRAAGTPDRGSGDGVDL